jgi:hypothetical protein
MNYNTHLGGRLIIDWWEARGYGYIGVKTRYIHINVGYFVRIWDLVPSVKVVFDGIPPAWNVSRGLGHSATLRIALLCINCECRICYGHEQ